MRLPLIRLWIRYDDEDTASFTITSTLTLYGYVTYNDPNLHHPPLKPELLPDFRPCAPQEHGSWNVWSHDYAIPQRTPHRENKNVRIQRRKIGSSLGQGGQAPGHPGPKMARHPAHCQRFPRLPRPGRDWGGDPQQFLKMQFSASQRPPRSLPGKRPLRPGELQK